MFSKPMSPLAKQKPDRNEKIHDFPCFDLKFAPSREIFQKAVYAYEHENSAQVYREPKNGRRKLCFLLQIRPYAIQEKLITWLELILNSSLRHDSCDIGFSREI